MILRLLLLLSLLSCTEPKQRDFVLPKNVDDLRGRLLQQIPEGRDIAGARRWMEQHGFACEAPMASPVDAHAQECRATHADAGQGRWTVVLIERDGRLADVQVH